MIFEWKYYFSLFNKPFAFHRRFLSFFFFSFLWGHNFFSWVSLSYFCSVSFIVSYLKKHRQSKSSTNPMSSTRSHFSVMRPPFFSFYYNWMSQKATFLLDFFSSNKCLPFCGWLETKSWRYFFGLKSFGRKIAIIYFNKGPTSFERILWYFLSFAKENKKRVSQL